MTDTNTIGFLNSASVVISSACRQACGYCSFRSANGSLLPLRELEDALYEIRSGKAVEVVFVSGECPQEYPHVQMALKREECGSYSEYLEKICRIALQLEILPVLSIGFIDLRMAKDLREVACSVIIDAVCDDLASPGCAHENARGRTSKASRESIEHAHAAELPYNLNFLIGIGETREKRIGFIREMGRFCAVDPYLQDVRITPFQPQPGTAMRERPPLGFDEVAEAFREAKEVFPVHCISLPVNLFHRFPELVQTGLNDCGSFLSGAKDPVLPDFPWPTIDDVRKRLLEVGFTLQERLPLTTPAASQRTLIASVFEACRHRVKNRDISGIDLTDDKKCFVCGSENPIGLKLDMQMTGIYSCKTTWTGTTEFQGYSGIIHGGILSTILDEIMAQCLIKSGVKVVTAEMSVRFLKPAPVGVPLTFIGTRIGGRRNLHYVRGNVAMSNGVILAVAEGRFMEC